MLYSFFQNKLSRFVFSTFSAALFLIASLGLTPHAIAATASSTDDDFSFVILGDFNGGACGRNDRVQRVINAANEIPDVDFFISTGDIIDGYKETVGDKTYASCFGQDPVATIGADACPDGVPNGNMREMLAPLITRTPKPGLDSSFYMAIGNHDDNWGSGWYPDSCGGGICDLMDESVIRSIVGEGVGNVCSLEKTESTHSRKFYYSFSYKGSYFIVLKQNNDYASMLNCNGVGEGYSSCDEFCSAPEMVDDSYRNRMCYNVAQYDWLKAELENASTSHENIFVFTHAVFLTGGDGHRPFSGATQVRKLLEDYNVKIAFNGHNHAYHRSHPIKGNVISPDNGTTYLTVGSSGGLFNYASETEFTAKRHQAWTARTGGHEFDFGMTTYSKVDVQGETIKVSTYNLHSKTVAVDEFTIGELVDTDGDGGGDGDTGSELENGDASEVVAVNASAVSGAINVAGDADSYYFNVISGQNYQINAAGLDLKIKLLDENGTSLTDYIDNDGLANDGEIYTFVATTTGLMGVQLEHGDGYANPTGTYTLAIKSSNAVVAFPGATGFGAKATGGRGGRVIKVTTLDATGPGSLQEALNQNEPRIIVFDVSGVIESKEPIVVKYGNVTIAGQTAPGAGITLKSRLYGAYDDSVKNIIIRHLRVRPHDFSEISGVAANQYDAVQFSKNSQLIFDHVSVAFGVDETFDVYSAKDVTVQWSIIQDGSTLGDAGTHNYGLISGPEGKRISVNNNLFVNNANRNPAITNGPAEVVNNVIYNARHGFIHHNPASGNFNIKGNYFKQGPNNSLHPFYFDGDYNDAKYFLNDNYINDPLDPEFPIDQSVDNPWTIPQYFSLAKPESTRSATTFDFRTYSSYVSSQAVSSTQAYDNVLTAAGNFPRDVVDNRDVTETQTGGGAWGARVPADLMVGLSTTPAAIDSDGDGMADAWEQAHQLNPAVADDKTVMASGYTAIEVYINELADQLLPEVIRGDDEQPIEYTVTLNIEPNDGGQVQGEGLYEQGSSVTISAEAAAGYQFVAWRGDITSTENPLTISVDENVSLTADFEAAPSGSTITDLFDDDDRAGTWVNFKEAVLLQSDRSIAEIGDRVKTIQPIRGTASEMVAYGEGYYLRADDNGNPYLEATGDDAYEFIMPGTSLSYVIAWAAKVDPVDNPGTNLILHGAVDYHYYDVSAGYKDTALKISTGWSGKMIRELGDAFTSDPHVTYYQHHWTAKYSPQPGDLYFDGANINDGTERGGNYKIGGGYKLSLLGQNWEGNMEKMITADVYGFVVLDGHHPDKVDAVHAELQALFSGESSSDLPPVIDNDNGGIADTPEDDNTQPVEFTVTLNIEPNDGGQVQGEGLYEQGSSATITASAAAGYQFVAWRGDITSTENPLTISVDENVSLTADFEVVPSDSTITDLFDDGDRAGTWVNFKEAVLLQSDGSIAELGDRVKTIQPIRGTASDMVAYGEGYYLREDNNGNPYLEATGDDAYEFIMPETSWSYIIAWAANVDPVDNPDTNLILHGAVDYHYYPVSAGYKDTALRIFTGWDGKITRELGDTFPSDPHVAYYQHHWTGKYSPHPGDLHFDGANINDGTEIGGNYKVGGVYKLSLLGQNWDGNMEKMITADVYGFVILDGHHPDKVDAVQAELQALFNGESSSDLPPVIDNGGIADSLEGGDAEAGLTKSASCAACHGEQGISHDDLMPNLAGQKKAYLMKQMHDFKNGSRVDEAMSSLAATLSDDDIADLAEFYSGL